MAFWKEGNKEFCFGFSKFEIPLIYLRDVSGFGFVNLKDLNKSLIDISKKALSYLDDG